MNCFSVDVEEYFQCEAFAPHVPVASWPDRSARVDVGTDRLLELLAQHNLHATFFILGWVAERRPDLVRRIADAGHEIASHGYGHQHLRRLSPESFRDDVRRSLDVLQGIVGRPVLGYRAPTFSVIRQTAWAVPILIEAGLRYDSSIYPIHHDRYGVPEAPVGPFWLQAGGQRVLEIPPLALTWWKLNVPVGGGGYLRLLPARFVSRAIRRANAAGRPAMIYIHPWELDPDQPRLPCTRMTRFRHYLNLSRTARKLGHLFSRHSFTTATTLADTLGLDPLLPTWSFDGVASAA